MFGDFSSHESAFPSQENHGMLTRLNFWNGKSSG